MTSRGVCSWYLGPHTSCLQHANLHSAPWWPATGNICTRQHLHQKTPASGKTCTWQHLHQATPAPSNTCTQHLDDSSYIHGPSGGKTIYGGATLIKYMKFKQNTWNSYPQWYRGLFISRGEASQLFVRITWTWFHLYFSVSASSTDAQPPAEPLQLNRNLKFNHEALGRNTGNKASQWL